MDLLKAAWDATPSGGSSTWSYDEANDLWSGTTYQSDVMDNGCTYYVFQDYALIDIGTGYIYVQIQTSSGVSC